MPLDPIVRIVNVPVKGPVLWTDDGAWSEAQIPARPWIARGFLMRRAVTVISGPGGGGKSSLTVGWSAALATGDSIGRFQGADPGVCYRQLVYNVEDDRDEQRRRYSAALRAQGRDPAAIKGMIMRCGPTDVGTLIEHDKTTGEFRFTPAWDAFRELVETFRPDVVWLDPMVELHTAEENDNTALRHVIAHLRGLAVEFDCAVALIHHTRKGATAGDAEGIRGAGAIVGASRISITVVPMTADEAEEHNVPADMRDLYFRVDGAKANYNRRGAANWHTLQEYELDNGDIVAAVLAWQPGDGPKRGLEGDPDRMAALEAELRRGTPDGPYSPRLSHAEPRSVLPLLLRLGVTTRSQQQAALGALSQAGWRTANFRSAANRALKQGLRSPDGAPKAAWTTDGPGNETP